MPCESSPSAPLAGKKVYDQNSGVLYNHPLGLGEQSKDVSEFHSIHAAAVGRAGTPQVTLRIQDDGREQIVAVQGFVADDAVR